MDAITERKILDELFEKASTLSLDELKADPNLIVTHGSDTGRTVIFEAEKQIAASEAENAQMLAAGCTNSAAYARNEKVLAILRPMVVRTRAFEAKTVRVTDRRLKASPEEESTAVAEAV